MDKPQKYDPSKGMQGNIEAMLWENQIRKNEISNEQSKRETDDSVNRVIAEQNYTDSFLDLIEVQQIITDIEIKNLELEARIIALEERIK